MIGSEPLHVAVIWAGDGPRLVTAAATRPALLERVSAYVAAHAAEQLWPEDAAHIDSCVQAGDHDGAISHYFDAAGRRWDDEQLHLCSVEDIRSLAGRAGRHLVLWHSPPDAQRPAV